jgi:DNA-binding Lrp family transcriptional regulator
VALDEVDHARVAPRGTAAFVPRETRGFPALARFRARMPPQLDKLDRRILALLQRDARISAEAIGAQVGLSASAVQRRTARLREEAVITGEVMLVDPRSVGRPLTMIVDLEVERERVELLANLKRWIATEAAIQEAWYVTGDEDYVLVVSACDVEGYEALMQQLLADNANVRRYRTRVVLGTLKRGMAVPVEPA